MIAPCAGALWVGLLMAAAGEPSFATPAATPAAETAAPANSIVAVRRPPPGDTVLGETALRLRSELAAMGLEGQFVDCPPTETDSGACPDAQASATISLARRDDGIVEIGVRTILPDGLELSRHVRVLARDGGDDPAVLAVRAVELLRDLRLTARQPAPSRREGPARDDEEPKLPPPPPRPPRWNLSGGIALFGSPRGDQPGVGPALGPTIGAGAIIGPRLTLVASVAGPFNSTLSSSGGLGTATLLQALATLELRFRLPLGPVEPFASVLTGVNYLKATLDTTTSAWVPMFGLGAGATWSLWKQLYFCFDAEAFVTQPDMLVLIDGVVVGRTGAPSIVASSSVGLTLP
ncbi:MAG TPA: hypothetical protein VLA79_03560 [Polyangia bacterium]|nr:hypothetical protein [Polyangia bacterium]